MVTLREEKIDVKWDEATDRCYMKEYVSESGASLYLQVLMV